MLCRYHGLEMSILGAGGGTPTELCQLSHPAEAFCSILQRAPKFHSHPANFCSQKFYNRNKLSRECPEQAASKATGPTVPALTTRRGGSLDHAYLLFEAPTASGAAAGVSLLSCSALP